MIKSIYDFEKSVTELIKRNEDNYKSTLEEYLRSILFQLDLKKYSKCSFDFIYEILEKAFQSDKAEFNQEWLEYDKPVDMDSNEDGYSCLIKTVFFQIADLRRMKDSGQLNDENRFFGIVSSSGNSWYNFDVFTYLERGVSGLVDHFEIDTYSDDQIDWDVFIGLLELGRLYE
jgi:hypothetical protein